MGDVIVSYDISALLVLAIGGVYYLKTSPNRTVRDSLFIYLLLFGIVAGVADIARIVQSDTNIYGTIPWNAMNTLYYMAICLLPPFFLMYIIEITDTWHRVARRRIWRLSVVIPTVACIVILALSFAYPILISVAADGSLIYGRGYQLLHLFLLISVLFDIVSVYRMRTYIGVGYAIWLIVPVIICMGAMLVQSIEPQHHIVVFAVSIDCLLLILIDRKTEESLDITTGMHSYWVFAKDMKLKISTGKNLVLILVNIVNFEHAIRIAGYDEVIEMLKPIASEITRTMGNYKGRYTCYYNGDGKFAIELTRHHFANVEEIATSITQSINKNLKLEIADFEIKLNTCLVNVPEDISDVESLFMLISDLDLFPSEGRILSAAEITGTKEFVMKKEMTTILDRAMSNHYFSVFYQPIYNIEERRFTCAEALIRLRDPKYGYISPGLFIPLAEKSGAIHNIGGFVIDEVCRFIASDEFEQLGLEYIEINLSVTQCLRADFADEIIDKTIYYGVEPQKLNLEITETASEYSQDRLRSTIQTLERAGFTFSLDDFGTGYSNLMRITSLPLSVIKLDRSFVLLEEKDKKFDNIFRNLIKMLKDMGKRILVEGIETEEMVNAFVDMGVDEIQGFYYSRPLTRTDFIRFLKEHNVGK